MGCYVNPREISKEEFLKQHGEETFMPCEISETHLPVVLIHNGPFNAAGVCFSEDERKCFATQDGRPKRWYKVSREKLREVSDLAAYER